MTKTTTTRAPRMTKKARDEAVLAAKREADAQAIAAITLPTQEQLDREAAQAQAEEAANLAREAEEMASEVKVIDGYVGPMLALRSRAKAGAYVKAANGQPCCADDVASILGALQPRDVIRACIIAMALPSNPYTHLNIGQQSMNLRNKLRGCLKRGEFGMGVLREAVEAVVEANQEGLNNA